MTAALDISGTIRRLQLAILSLNAGDKAEAQRQLERALSNIVASTVA
jgi:Tfp pilus assembly protein PilF